ncbi:MAG TPA: homoserine kinase, partial [Microbacteriaceae bacterium]|nr:homoserine kinase [Microbacteriaceae bacterium]
HQDYRAEAMPETHDLVQRLRAAGHAAVVSGAGPSILVLASDPAARAEAAALVAATATSRWDSSMLAVDVRGATVNALPMGAD